MTTPAPDVSAMPAGSELGALVAERVMGWRRAALAEPVTNPTPDGGSETLRSVLVAPDLSAGPLPRYSTDMTAAWDVVEHLRDNGVILRRMSYGSLGYHVIFARLPNPELAGSQSDGYGDTGSEAICRAALQAWENK